MLASQMPKVILPKVSKYFKYYDYKETKSKYKTIREKIELIDAVADRILIVARIR